MSALEELIARLEGMPPAQLAALAADAAEATKEMLWVPNPGPQTAALESQADELFYGGSAGGGKSDLGIGLALTEHLRSLILRRYTDDARSLAERMLEIIGDRKGYNASLLYYRGRGKNIDFSGCKDEADKQRFKGDPHDLIVFDEIGDFLESQYRFIIGWNRTSTPGQRTRILCTGNPPTNPEGLWVIDYWGPWLDPTHPNPANEGELRWFTTTDDGVDTEVDGRGPHYINGEKVFARSRTFIRARLDDNPNLTLTDDYRSVLASLPPELRAAYRDGRFDAGIADNPFQVIPTEWVLEAQGRWSPRPPPGVPMCAMGADVAQGGRDNNVIAVRHDGWYDNLTIVPGKETPLGKDISGHLLLLRKDGAIIVLDCGGGYGGAPFKTLQENGIAVVAYKGSEASYARTEPDKKLGFVNKRAETMWRFREALDPGQQWGSPISLPPDRVLTSDLTAPTFKVGPSGIQIESADSIMKRLGRSPDRGAAVILAWSEGQKAITHLYSPALGSLGPEQGLSRRAQYPSRANMGRRHQRRNR